MIASSPVAVRELGRYDVPADTIGHALPGVDPGPLATGSGGAGPVALLCVAILVPRKGHTVLLEALAGLVRLDWCLACVGGHDLHPAHAEAVRALTSRLGLDDRVAFMGAVAPEAMEPHYGRADVLVHPALYEGYGMVLTEAVARGLPIVGTTGGAIPEVVPAEAAILVPPGDVAALGEALARIIADADLRARLAAGARAARARLAGWRETADRFEAELERAIAA